MIGEGASETSPARAGDSSEAESLLKYHDYALIRANDACIRIRSVV